MPKKIGLVIHSISAITDVGPLAEALGNHAFEVIVFANADTTFKPQYNPFLLQQHLRELRHHKLVWYRDMPELHALLQQEAVQAVFTEEAWPFVLAPEHFQNRSYKIYNLVHSVDNFHLKAAQGRVLDLSFVGFEKYGEYLDWGKETYRAFGLPKYDVVSRLNREAIIKKYNLPKRYILLLTPNNNLLSVYVVYRMIREIKKHGYGVVLKGKYPKCHKRIYPYLSEKYFLSDVSFYPFITHELVFASSGVIGFDTTAVEEILMCERPLVNFSVKPYRDKAAREGNFKQFVPMWGAPFCRDLNIMDYHGFNVFKPLPPFMDHFEKSFDYKKIQQEVFSVPGGASERIVDFLEQNK